MNKRSLLVSEACRAIEAAEQEPSLAALAKAAGLSPFHFQRVFKAVAGVSPKAYAQGVRESRLREELRRAGSVTEAMHGAGYNSAGRFYAKASGALGMRPSRFRAGGKGETIRFAVGQSSLGAILVASSDKGVCAIFLGDEPGPLLRDLQGRFPKAELVGDDVKFERTVARVVGMIEAPGTGADLPLDIRGTAFQQRVWRALREIPAGKTATYAEVAKRIGAPKSVRAVAGACALNKIAVAIPCHRVVKTGGGLSGYRWGVERKRALLERESGFAKLRA